MQAAPRFSPPGQLGTQLALLIPPDHRVPRPAGLLTNLARQIQPVSFAHIGCTYDLDFHVTPWRLAPRTILPFLSAGRLATPIATPFGWFGLDSTSLVALPALTTGIGVVRYSLPVPASYSLRGANLHTQALFQIATWRTSNVVSERVN